MRSHAWVSGTAVADVEPFSYVSGAGVGVAPPDPVLTTLDFSAASVGPGTFTRASSGHTVRTGTGTIDSTSYLTNDSPRFGRRADGRPLALAFAETRTNTVLQNRNMTAAVWTTSVNGTISRDRATGYPGVDGQLVATRFQTTGTAWGYPQFALAATNPHILSAWARAHSGTSVWSSNYAGGYAWIVTVTTTYSRQKFKRAGTGGQHFYPVDTYGGNSTPEDVYVDFPQCENGSFTTDAIVTGATAATRAGEHLEYPAAVCVDAGRLTLEVRCRPYGSSSEYSANLRLWTDKLDATTYAEIDCSTHAVIVSVVGVTYTTPVTMSWAADDLLEIVVAVGAGATYVGYRVNGGTWTVLSTGTPTSFGAFAPAGAIELFCSGTTKQLSADHEVVRFYRSGSLPAMAA